MLGLDDETEKTLANLRRLPGLSISEVRKRGLMAYMSTAMREASENHSMYVVASIEMIG